MEANMTGVTETKRYHFSMTDSDGYTYNIVLNDKAKLTSYETDLPDDVNNKELETRLSKAVQRAKFILDRRSELDILSADEDPYTYDRALTVLDSMSDEQFESQFAELKQALVNPTPEVHNDNVTFDTRRIISVYEPVFFNIQSGLVTSGKPRYIYENTDGKKLFVGEQIESPLHIEAPPLNIGWQNEDDTEIKKIDPNEISTKQFRTFIRENIKNKYVQCYEQMGIETQ